MVYCESRTLYFKVSATGLMPFAIWMCLSTLRPRSLVMKMRRDYRGSGTTGWVVNVYQGAEMGIRWVLFTRTFRFLNSRNLTSANFCILGRDFCASPSQ